MDSIAFSIKSDDHNTQQFVLDPPMIDLLDSPTMDSPNGSTPTSTMQYPLVLDAFFPAHLTAIQNGMALLMVPVRLQLCYVLFREASLLQGYVFSDFLKAKSLVNAVDGFLQFVFVSLWMVYFFGLFIPFVVLPSFLYGISFLPLCQLLGIVSTSNLEILEFAGQTCFEQLFVNWMPFIETAINSVLCSIIVVQYIRFKSTDPDDYFEPLTKAAQVWWSVRCLWIFLIHIINAILFFVIRYFKNQWIIYAISYHITVISPMLDLLVYDLLLYLGQTMKEDIWVVKKIIADLIEAAETLKEKAMSKHRASVTPIVEIEMENRAPDTENARTTEPVPATA
ncbi:Protein CBG27533 [Caenorhabditis briggsae]|uniref:Transmembrane protein n=2 Tax=Caenorhabditis briggsae TaxID=6238 RepID=A0AAE8ZN42_CAEBR|nr:Protein CBG27533 [Caenorhabditis briggsae]ULT80999.1 hypothetical protein L3Y34_011098 [Caenorhabditis briggsae]CAS00424.1 Protein CBG27533 [Caenorhabditis briggsae]